MRSIHGIHKKKSDSVNLSVMVSGHMSLVGSDETASAHLRSQDNHHIQTWFQIQFNQ